MNKGTSHKKQVHRLNRISGQVTGILGMIEDERYCIDILNQIKAVKSALSSVENHIIEEHLNHCVHSAVKTKNIKESNKMIEEIKELLKKARL